MEVEDIQSSVAGHRWSRKRLSGLVVSRDEFVISISTNTQFPLGEWPRESHWGGMVRCRSQMGLSDPVSIPCTGRGGRDEQSDSLSCSLSRRLRRRKRFMVVVRWGEKGEEEREGWEAKREEKHRY